MLFTTLPLLGCGNSIGRKSVLVPADQGFVSTEEIPYFLRFGWEIRYLWPSPVSELQT